MNHKYFQITEQSTLDHIEKCLVSISAREEALVKLSKEFGAKDCLQYSAGGIAAFTFNYNERPDKAVWKKVKHGFMPKVKTSEHMRIAETPKSIDYRDIIKKYSFGSLTASAICPYQRARNFVFRKSLFAFSAR